VRKVNNTLGYRQDGQRRVKDMKRSECTVTALKERGFRQIERLQEPTIKDIAVGIAEGFYEVKLEDDDATYVRESYEGDTMYYTFLTRRYYHLQYLLVRAKGFNTDWYRVLVREVEDEVWRSNWAGD
jgi:hypothetical protein